MENRPVYPVLLRPVPPAAPYYVLQQVPQQHHQQHPVVAPPQNIRQQHIIAPAPVHYVPQQLPPQTVPHLAPTSSVSYSSVTPIYHQPQFVWAAPPSTPPSTGYAERLNRESPTESDTPTATDVTLIINGEKRVVHNVDATLTLNEYLRSNDTLRGTKVSCAEAGCGACACIISYTNVRTSEKVHLSVNSCVRPLASCDGMEITTIEGLNSRTESSDVSRKLAAENGSQCGFCSSGMVMNMYGLLLKESPDLPTQQQVEDNFDGNLCRCTGYRPILAAMRSFAKDSARSCDSGSSCCSSKNGEKEKEKECTDEAKATCCEDIEDLCCALKKRLEKHQQLRQKPASLVLRGSEGVGDWYAPQKITELLALIKNNPTATKKFVAGNTSIGVYKDQNPDMWIFYNNIYNFHSLQIDTTGKLVIGAAITISELLDFLENQLQNNPSKLAVQYFPGLIQQLKRVANFLVRNAGSVAGNLMMEHEYGFVSDIWTALMGLGAVVKVIDANGYFTETPLNGFQNFDMTNKLIVDISVAADTTYQYYSTYKTMLRHVNSHAIVNAAFKAELDSSGKVLSQPTIVYGGIQKYACRAPQTEKMMVGRSWLDKSFLPQVLASLQQELQPTIIPAGGNLEYRASVILTLFYKFYLSVLPPSVLPPNLATAARPYDRPLSSGSQSYSDDPSEYPVSKPVQKLEALDQTSGRAVYTIDMDGGAHTLQGAFVLSTEASADIVSIDPSDALSSPGVVDFISYKDVPGPNSVTIEPQVPAEYQEEIFASKRVVYRGQAIGLVVADTLKHAQDAAKKVKVVYDTSKSPVPVLDLQDAISKKSFFPNIPGLVPIGPFTVGDVDKALSQAQHVIEDSIAVETQYHFTLETQTSLAIPTENQTMMLHSSTQWPAMTQYLVSRLLNLGATKVTVNTKRIGGAYGSKITRSIFPAGAAAIAANKLNKPVHVTLSLSDNMQLIGKRHPFQCNYQVGFDDTGKISALKMTYYADGGCSYDSTPGTMDMALTTADNCYYFPNYSVEGVDCYTNLPSNTPTRAPGCVPSIFFVESIVEAVANYLKKRSDDIKPLNFYTKNQVTPYGQPLPYFNLQSVWDQLVASCNFADRVKSVNDFNASNRWMKRGISLVPLKYGITWAARYGCDVNIYMDGTVGIIHSGIESGQGINTKVAQCAAYKFNIPMELIVVNTTSSRSVPNADSTGGSITSGLNSKAVMEACDELLKRLAPLRALLGMKHPKSMTPEEKAATWQELILKAYMAGVELKASSWVNWTSQEPFSYNSYGVTCTEVQVDALTGETQILRTDILFDCGISLNPAVDIGQVEGAFVMGIGYYLTEHIEYDQTSGELLTDSTWEYKPPSQKDIPIEFNVMLLKDAPNPVGILRSKASGEPPLCMSCSVFFAVRDAIKAARADAGLSSTFTLDPPALVTKIQQQCGATIRNLTW